MKIQIYKPTAKMRQVWSEKHLAKVRLLEGSVRSGKSFISNMIAINEISALPSCNILVSGYSISSVARNVIAEWRKIIDPTHKGVFKNVRDEKDDYLVIDYTNQKTGATLKDKKFYIRGAGKENDHKQIQGATFGYWYADELTKHTKSFVDMAITRLSLSFAKAVWTTNPDGPRHYIKTNYIENLSLQQADETGEIFLKCYSFVLSDNPSLTKQYIKSLAAVFSGVFYKRNILGLWVMAEGSIYDFFDKLTHTRKRADLPQTSRFVVGIDYGTGNPTCFILFGYNPYGKIQYGGKEKLWAIREYYWDSKKEGRQKTDAEYSADLKNWLAGREVDKIIVDPSAASFKVQLERDGFYGLADADNSVIDGIRTQARMLKAGEYVICEEGCPQTIEDYEGYVWDERAQERGEDKPLKVRDHTKDVERYVCHTLFGEAYIDYESVFHG